MMADEPEILNDAFAVLARDISDCAREDDNLLNLVSRILSLSERLGAILRQRMQVGDNSTISQVAFQEAGDMTAEIQWLRCHPDSIHRQELLQHVALAAQQGWTAVELLE
jgi:hypothetical protein